MHSRREKFKCQLHSPADLNRVHFANIYKSHLTRHFSLIFAAISGATFFLHAQNYINKFNCREFESYRFQHQCTRANYCLSRLLLSIHIHVFLHPNYYLIITFVSHTIQNRPLTLMAFSSSAVARAWLIGDPLCEHNFYDVYAMNHFYESHYLPPTNAFALFGNVWIKRF
jgi:hypothetical protein